MIVSHETALSVFEQAIETHYAHYSDLCAHIKSGDTERVYFSADPAAFAAGHFITCTVYDEEVVLDIDGNPEAIEEAVAYAKATQKPLYILTEPDTASALMHAYKLQQKDGLGYEHHGIFGTATACPPHGDSVATVRFLSSEDIPSIAALPIAEWGNLPILIRFTKDTSRILLAEIDGRIVGYLIYASSYDGYNDIVMVKVHTTAQQKGVGKALVCAFINLSLESGCLPYYGEAKSLASARLAAATGFRQTHPRKTTFVFSA